MLNSKRNYRYQCTNCGKGLETGGIAYSGLCQKCFKRFNICNPDVSLNGGAYIRDELGKPIRPKPIRIKMP